jgi:hypothetical protein
MITQLFSSCSWLLAAAVFVAWCGFWMWIAMRAVRAGGDEAIRTLANRLPPFVITTSLLAFLLMPTLVTWPSIQTRAIHYFGIGFLFVFLVLGVFFQIEVWRKIERAENLESLLASYRRWWVATKLMPATGALAILFSGLRLTYESPGMDVSAVPWLEYLVVSFSFFFFDGLTFYLPEICRVYRHGVKAKQEKRTPAEFLKAARDWKSEATLLFHSISFPFVFALACARPGRLPVPTAFNRLLASHFTSLPLGYAQMCRAATVIMFVGTIIFILRLPGLIRRNREG